MSFQVMHVLLIGTSEQSEILLGRAVRKFKGLPLKRADPDQFIKSPDLYEDLNCIVIQYPVPGDVSLEDLLAKCAQRYPDAKLILHAKAGDLEAIPSALRAQFMGGGILTNNKFVKALSTVRRQQLSGP